MLAVNYFNASKVFKFFREENAQLCIYVGNERVIDLWGVRDPTNKEAQSYGPDKLQTIFSSGKSLAAIAVACLVDQGVLDYNEKVMPQCNSFTKLKTNRLLLTGLSLAKMAKKISL